MSGPAGTGLGRLRELAAGRRQRAGRERCEFCGADMAPEHGHVVNVPQRSLLCVCRPCHLLFTHEGAGGGRFRAVPDRYRALTAGALDPADWDALEIPVGVAFFFLNSARGRVAGFYPGPAGATESELSLERWEAIVQAAPELGTLAPDVEALLVRRAAAGPGGWPGPDGTPGRVEAFIVPIDVCYELVGRLRQEWRGFQGGDRAWQAIDRFFARVAGRAAAEPV